jgi:hypothetical protein
MQGKPERPAVTFWDLVLFCAIAAAPVAILGVAAVAASIWIMRNHLGWGA